METTMKRLEIQQWTVIHLPFSRTARRSVPALLEGGEVVLGPAARPGSIGASTILYGIAALPIEVAPRPTS